MAPKNAIRVQLAKSDNDELQETKSRRHGIWAQDPGRRYTIRYVSTLRTVQCCSHSLHQYTNVVDQQNRSKKQQEALPIQGFYFFHFICTVLGETIVKSDGFRWVFFCRFWSPFLSTNFVHYRSQVIPSRFGRIPSGNPDWIFSYGLLFDFALRSRPTSHNIGVGSMLVNNVIFPSTDTLSPLQILLV